MDLPCLRHDDAGRFHACLRAAQLSLGTATNANSLARILKRLPATRTTPHLRRDSREVCAEKPALDPPEAGVDIAQFLVDLRPEVADFHL